MTDAPPPDPADPGPPPGEIPGTDIAGAEVPADLRAVVEFRHTGPAAPWSHHLVIAEGRLRVADGTAADAGLAADVVLTADGATVADIRTGQISPQQALLLGRLTIAGDPMVIERCGPLLATLVPPAPRPV